MEPEYWNAKCRACGWQGSSKDTDTGDELRCPHCNSTLIEEADDDDYSLHIFNCASKAITYELVSSRSIIKHRNHSTSELSGATHAGGLSGKTTGHLV